MLNKWVLHQEKLRLFILKISNVPHIWALKNAGVLVILTKVLMVAADSPVTPNKWSVFVLMISRQHHGLVPIWWSGLLSLPLSLLWECKFKTDADAKRTPTPFQITGFICLPVYGESWLSAVCKCRRTDLISVMFYTIGRVIFPSTVHSAEAGNIIKFSCIFPQYPAQSFNH